MPDALTALIESGTRLWLDSVDPDELDRYVPRGITGATSNPSIIESIIRAGDADVHLAELLEGEGEADDEAVAWALTDRLVARAQRRFTPVHEATDGNDGYVSFELDPLIDAPEATTPHDERVARYVELARQWSAGHANRMIKVPATPAGIGALEPITAAGVTPNVTLIFSRRQYRAAREAIWRGAQARPSLEGFKSVYSIFISRLDVWAEKRLTGLDTDIRRQLGLLNAKRIWIENHEFWADKNLPLDQEIIFASTSAKLEGDPPDRYVRAVAGGGIQTNPPDTLAALVEDREPVERTVDRLPEDPRVRELDDAVDEATMESELLEEGLAKFADPHRELLERVADRRARV